MQDVAIVGGGVVGLSLARAFARAGASVELFERSGSDEEGARERSANPASANPASGNPASGNPASGNPVPWSCDGASSLPVALVNPWRGRKGAAHPDDRAGLAVTWRWAEELAAEGFDPGAQGSGVLRIPTSERQARRWRTGAQDEPTLTWLGPGEVPDGVRAPHGALHVDDGGWIRAASWRAALAGSARLHGAELHAGADVSELTRTDAGWQVACGNGTPREARTVLLALGADAPPPVSGAPGPAWPGWIRTRGDEVALAGEGRPAVPIAGGVYASWDGAETWIGGGHRPADRRDRDAPHKLRRAIGQSVPALKTAAIERVWSGVRAKRADARPVIERWRDGVWIVGAFAGRGFLCAGLEAERLATAWRDGELV